MTYFGLRGGRLLNFITLVIIMPVYFWFGYNQAVAGGLLTLPSFIAVFPSLDTVYTTGETKSHNATVQGTVVALYTAGCAIGALFCIIIGDRLGRLRTGFSGCIVSIVGSVLQASSFSLGQLIVGRVVAGLGFGLASATFPVWQAECAGTKHRGSFVVVEGIFISVGLFISQYLTLGFYFVDNSASWRFPLAFPILFGLIVISLILKFPESPRWLVKKGRIEEAREVLAALNDVTIDDPIVTENINNFEFSLEETGKGHFKDLFTIGHNRLLHRTILAAGAQFFQQMNGINVIGFYAGALFEEYLGLSPIVSRVLSACTFTFEAACALIAYYTIDRFGRRKLMIWAALGMGLCMVSLAITISRVQVRGAAVAASIFIFLFCGFFPIGFLGLPFLYATEIAPLAHRVSINAISTATTWLFNFFVAEVTPVALDNIEYKFYVVFAVLNLVMIMPSVYFFYPETNGRSLEEIDFVFLNSKSIFDTVSVANELTDIIAAQGLNELRRGHTDKPNAKFNENPSQDPDPVV